MIPELPRQPHDAPWPTRAWPVAKPSAAVDGAKLDSLLDYAFSADTAADLGQTHAVVIIQRGRLIAERYLDGSGPLDTRPSWSMAKSITHALVGIAVKDGLLDIFAPADVPEWQKPGDPRAAITLDLLLRMSSGLDFVEEYEPGRTSDVREMLWGAGKDDVAAFAANFPLKHEPGKFFSYSSGTTNIVSRCLARALGRTAGDFAAYLRERLFEPLGMTSVKPKFDLAGTFIGSSYCFATPQDFARFGLLYLRDGVWDGQRILPERWVDYARTRTYQQPQAIPDGMYGAHWWLGHGGAGSFSAIGYQGQFIVICPDRDLIVVRNGATPAASNVGLKAWVLALTSAFPPLAAATAAHEMSE